MRVRIVKTLSGVIDGRALSTFLCDFAYDIPSPLALQLIEIGAGVAVRSTDPVIPTGTDDLDLVRLSGGVTVVPPDRAPDRSPRRRKTRR